MDNVEKMVEGELTAAQKLAQFEKEKLTRRQALAKFGFQAGAAAVAALTADELLRKVGKEMQRRAEDNKVAQQVAKEFQQAGVAFAESGCYSACTVARANSILYSCTPLTGQAYISCCTGAYVTWCKCIKNNNCPEASSMPAQCSSCQCVGGC